MAEEEEQQAPTETVEQPTTQKESEDTFTLEEIEKLNREIEETKRKVVSEDINQKITAERDAAKKEAEKEFLVNQRVKDLEREKEELQKKNEESQRNAAAQLEALKAQVDKLMTSKVVAVGDNPFKKPEENSTKETGLNVDGMDDEELRIIEEASFQAFLEQKSKN